ncbi:MAG: hypothetical protein PVJ68_10900, partial [Candidatus Thiodiazotropha sp.]
KTTLWKILIIPLSVGGCAQPGCGGEFVTATHKIKTRKASLADGKTLFATHADRNQESQSV